MSIYGCNIAKGASDYDDHDHSWWVYFKDLKMFVLLPPGKVPVIDDYPIPFAPSDEEWDITLPWPAHITFGSILLSFGHRCQLTLSFYCKTDFCSKVT
jgi:hypothetical protein